MIVIANLNDKMFSKPVKKETDYKDFLVAIADELKNENIAKPKMANLKVFKSAKQVISAIQSAPKPAMPYAGRFAAIASSNSIDAKCAVINPPKRTTMTTPSPSKCAGSALFITP